MLLNVTLVADFFNFDILCAICEMFAFQSHKKFNEFLSLIFLFSQELIKIFFCACNNSEEFIFHENCTISNVVKKCVN